MVDERICILIVDDEPDLLDLCSDILEMEEFEVFTASNGEEALEIITREEKEKFNVIISDSSMPKMGGRELFKSLPKENKILFYMSTGLINVEEETLIKEGMTGLFSKPYDIDLMVQQIRNDLEKV